MLDLSDHLEAFIITNGRSTLEYALKALEGQTCKFKITVIRDMKWVDALNRCVKLCKTKHYLRCDDDHIFHPSAVHFMWKSIKRKDNTALFACKLWEDWTKRIGGGSKMYNRELVRKIGGFRANHLGKVDKLFSARVRKSPYRLGGGGDSIVGLHCCAPFDEQVSYEKLWSKLATKPYQKTTHDSMKKYKKSIKEQYEMRTKFILKLNRKSKSGFYTFIKKVEK